jgi:serine/threonine protein kinase
MTTTAPPPAGAPGPAGKQFKPWMIAVAATLGVLVVALVAALLVNHRVHQRRALTAAGVDQESRYIEHESIGVGAFGQVRRVTRKKDGQVFALKHMECPSHDVLNEALAEFDILRKLQAHPKIIRIVDMFLNFEVDDAPPPNMTGSAGSGRHTSASGINAQARPEAAALLGGNNTRSHDSHEQMVPKPTRHLCLVMDYHAQGDLKKWVNALPPNEHVPEPVICHIAVQILSVLTFMHLKNIVHRDLKPENVLMVSDQTQPAAVATYVQTPPAGGSGTRASGTHGPARNPLLQDIVVTDFGLSHMAAENKHSESFVGTAVYSAPECVALLKLSFQRSGKPAPAGLSLTIPSPLAPVTSQCDMWSLGCVMYAIATRRFDRTNVRKMFDDVEMASFERDIYRDVEAAGYSKPFAALLLRLLQLQPDPRPPADAALKYFRKRREDQSYYVSERMGVTAAEAAAAERAGQSTSEPNTSARL